MFSLRLPSALLGNSDGPSARAFMLTKYIEPLISELVYFTISFGVIKLDHRVPICLYELNGMFIWTVLLNQEVRFMMSNFI